MEKLCQSEVRIYKCEYSWLENLNIEREVKKLKQNLMKSDKTGTFICVV